jgi:hypothetical protein
MVTCLYGVPNLAHKAWQIIRPDPLPLAATKMSRVFQFHHSDLKLQRKMRKDMMHFLVE